MFEIEHLTMDFFPEKYGFIMLQELNKREAFLNLTYFF